MWIHDKFKKGKLLFDYYVSMQLLVTISETEYIISRYIHSNSGRILIIHIKNLRDKYNANFSY